MTKQSSFLITFVKRKKSFITLVPSGVPLAKRVQPVAKVLAVGAGQYLVSIVTKHFFFVAEDEAK
jgi:hypothetical protein